MDMNKKLSAEDRRDALADQLATILLLTMPREKLMAMFVDTTRKMSEIGKAVGMDPPKLDDPPGADKRLVERVKAVVAERDTARLEQQKAVELQATAEESAKAWERRHNKVRRNFDQQRQRWYGAVESHGDASCAGLASLPEELRVAVAWIAAANKPNTTPVKAVGQLKAAQQLIEQYLFELVPEPQRISADIYSCDGQLCTPAEMAALADGYELP